MDYVHVLSYGGQVTLIGLAFVFVALATLIFCIWLMSRILRAFSEGKKKQAEVAAVEEAPTPAAAPVETIEEAEGIDPGVIAAIAAAISAFTDSGKQLVIRSVRRSNNWARAARSEQIGRF